MKHFVAHVAGIGFWSPTLSSWERARAVMRGDEPAADPPQAVPAPARLAPAERRRAPLTVSLALAAAEEAVAQSGLAPSSLQAVFSSSHGDMPVIDDICRTLASAPTLVSPTRFLHSIHNAPVGFWSLLTGNTRAAVAVSGAACGFAQGLMEALTQCASTEQPVLYVAYDTEPLGSLVHTTASKGSLSIAMVLTPESMPEGHAEIHWRLDRGTAPLQTARSQALKGLMQNTMAPALTLLEALAAVQETNVALPISDHQSLALRISPKHGG